MAEAKHYLITGAAGFAGRHLAELLAGSGQRVTGVVRRPSNLASSPAEEFVADLTNSTATAEAIAQAGPDGIFHLAAPQTSVGQSWKDPEGTKRGNVQTVRTVLEAAQALENKPRVLVVSSSEVYGKVSPEEQPLNEDSPQRPDSPYAESKQATEQAALEFAENLEIILARPFNHIGPGQSDKFALPSFAKQITEIEQGASGPLKHGNLTAKRDFTDVRDVVRAYHLLMTDGRASEVYNIGTGQARSVQELLDMLVAESPAKIEVVVDKDRFRPSEVPIMECDAGKIRKLGWEPSVPIEQTIRDILADARQRITTN